MPLTWQVCLIMSLRGTDPLAQIWREISNSEANVKKMIAYVTNFQKGSTASGWARAQGLSVEDAVKSLGRLIAEAERDRKGHLVHEIDEE